MRPHRIGLVLLSIVSRTYATAQKHFVHPSATSVDSEAHIHNATDNLIFTSVASLLQQWPNTRFRNGHTVVKATTPAGTILYHARRDQHVPSVPEWTGFNVEHSYLLCAPPECWMLTFMVEEPLNVVYFDGSSASNSYLGHQDSQDVLLWGRIRPDKIMAEWERIRELCKWGRQYNLDGIVRMEPGFEVMLCDFNKKIKLISSIHIMAPTPKFPNIRDIRPDILRQRQKIRMSEPSDGLKDDPQWPSLLRPPQPLPPNWVGPLRDYQSMSIESIHAAWWNNFYPGEVRARIDYTRLVSFYDPVYTSLLAAREGIPRNRHRLFNISTDDLQLAISHLHSDFIRKDDRTSGIDWSALTRAVTDRYADRLYSMKTALAVSNVQKSNATVVATTIRRQVMVMLTPYLLYGALPDSSSSMQDTQNTSWVEPMVFYCQTSLTSGIVAESLTRSEQLIKRSIEGVLHRICKLLGAMWVDAFAITMASEERATELIEIWRDELEILMQWLDWPMWDTCRPSCPEEMFCYIPTWPWGVNWTEEDPDMIDMTPQCIDRVTGELGDFDI
ncbi:hypothetical protein M408DRAFT_329495 [Serendipita vermifera MAFF 305830]|uniref:Uncharacterized protein n=1 Tax=Serendipita vermifera MAFF 305830 TaxID=933852 RepID=A0A0C3BAF2_SERVB|nr:hypothetical protein M408DRAFT_329495 [Serendipita vermifera MAFF 305830]